MKRRRSRLAGYLQAKAESDTMILGLAEGQINEM